MHVHACSQELMMLQEAVGVSHSCMAEVCLALPTIPRCISVSLFVVETVRAATSNWVVVYALCVSHRKVTEREGCRYSRASSRAFLAM